MIHNQPYGELAKIYDRVMEHVHYDEWAHYLSSVFSYLGVNVVSILETACGTGSLSVYLHQHGYDVTGMDLSPAMLMVAAEKFRKQNIPLKLCASSMTSIPVDTTFDAVLCLYDSINYLKAPKDLLRGLEEAYRVTRPGGIYIFDVCTIRNSQLFFSNNSLGEDFGEIKYTRTCFFYDYTRIQENFFIIEHDGKQYTEKHLQKIYKLEEVNRIIAQSRFRKIGMFEDMTFNPGSEESERVHFILEKK